MTYGTRAARRGAAGRGGAGAGGRSGRRRRRQRGPREGENGSCGLARGNSSQDGTAEEEFGKAAVRTPPLRSPRPSREAPRQARGTLLRTSSGFCCCRWEMGLLARRLSEELKVQGSTGGGYAREREGRGGSRFRSGALWQGRCPRAPPRDGNGFANPTGKAPPLVLSAELGLVLEPGVRPRAGSASLSRLWRLGGSAA